jgi:hypothetical protein
MLDPAHKLSLTVSSNELFLTFALDWSVNRLGTVVELVVRCVVNLCHLSSISGLGWSS